MDHSLMVWLLEKKIDDKGFIRLISALLKGGYLEDWVYHKTYSGRPQGGIISPILSNIYRHELDNYVEKRIVFSIKGKEDQKTQNTDDYLTEKLGSKEKCPISGQPARW